MACKRVLSMQALALVAALAAMAHAALAQPVEGRRLDPSYCNGLTRTDLDGKRFENGMGSNQGLQYYGVAMLPDGSPVKLVVTNTTPYWNYPSPPGGSSATGLVGQNVGQISTYMRPTEQPDGQCFAFHYENERTGEHVNLGNTILTLLDMDNVNDGCREVYRICNRDVSFLSQPGSSLTTTDNGECTDYSSSRTNVNNPTNSHALTSEQVEAGLGILFSDTLNVCMRLEGNQCANTNRNFMFGGLSSIDNCRLQGSSTSNGGTSGSTSGAASGGTSGSTATASNGGTSSGGGTASNGGTGFGTASNGGSTSGGGGTGFGGASTGGTGGTGTGPGAASSGGVGASSAPAACGSTCTYAGRTSTCRDHFNSVQRGGGAGASDSMEAAPVACANAWAVVVDTCDACKACGLSHVCQGMFEMGPKVWPQAPTKSTAAAFAVVGLSAGLVTVAAVLGLARAQRPAPAATTEGPGEAPNAISCPVMHALPCVAAS